MTAIEYGSPGVARAVFDEVGIDVLMLKTGRSRPAVYRWRREGFPVLMERLLRKEMPGLAAWKMAAVSHGGA